MLSAIGKHVFVEKGRPAWLWFVVCTTAVYLLVEFSFNARLLDVVGGNPTVDDVDSIEVYGRLISGFALALAAWPPLLARAQRHGYTIGMTVIPLVVVSGVLIGFAYKGEKLLVDTLVEHSNAADRYVALNLRLLQEGLVEHDVELVNLPLAVRRPAAPDIKTFLATFPLLASPINDLQQKIADRKPMVVRNSIDRRYGGLQKAYGDYRRSVAELQRRYNEDYVVASNRAAAVADRIPAEQTKAWNDYVRDLQRHRLQPGTVPRLFYAQVRRKVQLKGVPVRSDWVPSDRAGFNAAIARRVEGKIRGEFAQGIRKRFPEGQGLAPYLSWEEFAAHPAIQAYWKKQLAVPDLLRLRPDFNDERQYASQVYEPLLDIRQAQNLRQLDAPAAQFANGAPYEMLGKDAVRALVVPPIALGFSLLGALVHVFKLLLGVTQLTTRRAFANGFYKTVAILVAAATVFASANLAASTPITQQKLFVDRLYPDAQRKYGRSAMWLVRGAIHLQPFAYPLFEYVRTAVLGGLTFGAHTQE